MNNEIDKDYLENYIEHIAYEFKMFFTAYELLKDKQKLDYIDSNLSLLVFESYLLHLRNIFDFLKSSETINSNNKQIESDFIAKKLFKDSSYWETIKDNFELKIDKWRINKLLQHPSVERNKILNSNDKWEISVPTKDVSKALNYLLDLNSELKIYFQKYIPDLSKFIIKTNYYSIVLTTTDNKLNVNNPEIYQCTVEKEATFFDFGTHKYKTDIDNENKSAKSGKSD